MIETIFRYRKEVNEFDGTHIHEYCSIISSKFVGFVSTAITSRLLKVFDETGLFENLSYDKAMKLHKRAKKARIDSRGRSSSS